eukprot:COSAG02_NODE_1136_length_14337_cov_50.495505_6_plen_50_part_00
MIELMVVFCFDFQIPYCVMRLPSQKLQSSRSDPDTYTGPRAYIVSLKDV